MGWTGYPEYASYTPNRYWEEIYLPNVSNWGTPGQFSVVAENSHENEFYLAVHDKFHNVTYAIVLLMKKDKYGLWIKEIDSSMGPCYYNASKEVLDALTNPPYNDLDKEWREKCLFVQNGETIAKEIKNGDIIRFSNCVYLDSKVINTFTVIDKNNDIFKPKGIDKTVRIVNWKQQPFETVISGE